MAKGLETYPTGEQSVQKDAHDPFADYRSTRHVADGSYRPAPAQQNVYPENSYPHAIAIEPPPSQDPLVQGFTRSLREALNLDSPPQMQQPGLRNYY